MKMNHSLMVRTLFKNSEDVIKTLNPNRVSILHAAVGVAGEAAEVLDEVKKCVFNNRDFDLAKLTREMGDVEFYLEALRQSTGITRDECLADNMVKLGDRYKDFVYSDQAATARADMPQRETFLGVPFYPSPSDSPEFLAAHNSKDPL